MFCCKKSYCRQDTTVHQLWIGLVCKRVSCSVDELWWPDDSTISYYKGPDEIAGGNALALNTANGGWPAYATEDTHFYICERVDTCLSSPCLNGGTCLLNNATGNYSCECPTATGGDNCACDGSWCQNRPCADGADDFTCNCGEHVTGPFCEVDVNECRTRPNLCSNGDCSNTIGIYVCTCDPGYTGSHCGQDIDEYGSKSVSKRRHVLEQSQHLRVSMQRLLRRTELSNRRERMFGFELLQQRSM